MINRVKSTSRARGVDMRYFKFRVDVFHPPEYRSKFYEIMDNEKKKGEISYQHKIEEAAPPPELLKDIVIITASTLNILQTLYNFYNIIKNKKGRVYVTSKGKKFDLEAYNLDEIKVKIGEASIKKYKIELSFPNLTQDEMKEAAFTLSFRPIYFKGKMLSRDSHVLWSDYDDDAQKVKATIHVDDQEINELYERGVPIYAIAESTRWLEGTPRERLLLTRLLLSLELIPSACKLEEF